MGKHKIIKSAAAVALTASVVATAAPGASAASYKTNAKDQLVHTSTGKLVKGWKVFGGKLYKNGKLAPAKKYKIIGTGAAQKLFYGPTLKKGYKTANSKTLLFKDGKLTDGWKQAGKNERLYKNGKLDKGYTVYTNVEGDKFLYQNGYLKKGQKTANRGGETLLFVDGKLAKGYVLHEASKTLFNNGKVAEGLVKYPETDGKFYNDGKLANGEINGAEYKDGVLVAKDIASVKAINDTTVEVTFKKDQKDVKASDFKIEGLEVKNAATKQGDDKIVILTTSKQEAGKEYTLVYKEADTKTFTAKSDVIPTAISANKITDYQTSQQAVIGQQVTVKSVVTVAEGQTKAGIPVTFNISSNYSKFGEDKVVEVLTDENGVASYTYTQYKADDYEDTVIAYPTGKPELRTTSTVYWKTSDAKILKVTDVTTDSKVANNGKKVYKVTGGEAGDTVNVTFAENYEVTADKVDYKAKVVDATTGNTTSPYQIKNGNQSGTTITLNNKGEGEFTVSGENTSVTPVVFEDYSPANRLNVDERQATASKVTFSNIQTIGLTNVAQGQQYSAAAKTTISTNDALAENFGGRTYTATLTDKNGKTAPAGTKVYVTFDDANNSATNKAALFVFDKDGKAATTQPAAADGTKVYLLETDKDGKVTYSVASNTANNYATPVVYVENGSKAGLDPQDTQAKGEITYFGDAKVATAKLTFSKNGKEVTKAKAGETVDVEFQTVDQNGFPYAPTTDGGKVTLDFSTTFGNLDLSNLTLNVGGKEIKLGNTNNSVEATLSAKGDVIFSLKSDNESTVDITATTTKAGVGLVKGSIAFEGKSTGLVTTDIVAAVNNALDTDTIKKALADVAAYQDLNDKDAFAAKVLDELKDNKVVYTAASLTKEIADAKSSEIANAKVAAVKTAVAAVAFMEDTTKNEAANVTALQALVDTANKDKDVKATAKVENGKYVVELTATDATTVKVEVADVKTTVQ